MFWIKHINYEESGGKLRSIYNRVKGPGNKVDNILMAHSLRPHSLTGHMALYKNVIHNSNNTLPKWYLESLGVFVSFINNCGYCVDHHFEGLKRLWNDDKKSSAFLQALENHRLVDFFEKKWFAGVDYAKKLTEHPGVLIKKDVEKLKSVGFSDGEILEINQVVSYFNYANRTVLGLGVHTKGDLIGLSPNNSDDPDNWEHQ